MPFFIGCIFLFSVGAQADFLTEFPQLSAFVVADFHSPFRVGFGVIPFQAGSSKAGIGITPFTATVLNHWIEWNFFSVSWASGFLGGDASTNRISVTFRSALKLRLSDIVSLGPMIGIEYISFSNVPSRLFKNNLVSNKEPFSVNGLIFGGVLSELISIGAESWLQINEIFFIEKYNVSALKYGWTALFENNALNKDPSPLNPGAVFLLEVCILH